MPCTSLARRKYQMHELSIALSIIDLVQEESSAHGEVQVEAVHLKIGQLSGVVKDALVSSYEMATQDTPLEGSRLVIEEVPVVVNCPECKAPRPVHSVQSCCCAVCGTPTVNIVQGRELMVTALEVRS
jgi:hydrogenase nickel incorporation protein HypA/HybF